MKLKTSGTTLLLIFILGISFTPFSTAFTGSGAGTASDPFVITSWAELNQTFDNLTAHYLLANSLTQDSAGWSTYNGGNGWYAVGTFTGVFDGNYKIIEDLKLIRTNSVQGLFSIINGGTVKNLGLVNITVQCDRICGGIVGQLTTGTINESYVTNGTINSTNGGNSEVGGIAGASGGTIIRSYNNNVTIKSSNNRAGGLVGEDFGGVINRTYSTGSVSGPGGQIGGLTGVGSATNDTSYWNTETSGQATSGVGNPKTTAEMKNQGNYTGWDFTSIWQIAPSINNGYPTLLRTGSGAVITTLTSPAAGQIVEGDVTFNATLAPTANINVTNATLFLYYTNGTERYSETKTYTNNATSIDESWLVGKGNFSVDNFFYTVLSCGTFTNGTFKDCSYSSINVSFSWQLFEEISVSYNTATYETQSQAYTLNISTSEEVLGISAQLFYNGSVYASEATCSGIYCLVENTIDVPLLIGLAPNENKSFYWTVTIFQDSGTLSTNSTTSNQNVSDLIFTNSASGNTHAVNFSIHNETDRTLQKANFDASFNFWLGSGSVFDSYNFSGNDGVSYSFYINPQLNFITSSFIEISNVSKRLYSFNENYTNVTTNRKLFIPDSHSRIIIIETKDEGLIPIEGMRVNVSRYYPGIDSYEQIESGLTDEFGQVITNLIENDVKYRFSFYLDNVLVKTSNDLAIACRSTVCILPFIIEDLEDYFISYENVSLLDASFSFNNETNTFIYSWNDQTGDSATYRLMVRRFNLNESTIVCNVTSTSILSSLSCGVGSTDASYQAQVFRKIGTTERRIALLNIKVGGGVDAYGREGLFWAFILLMTSVGVGAFDPKIGAGLYGIGFIILGILQIISMPVPVFFANTLLVVIFIWAVRT